MNVRKLVDIDIAVPSKLDKNDQSTLGQWFALCGRLKQWATGMSKHANSGDCSIHNLQYLLHQKDAYMLLNADTLKAVDEAMCEGNPYAQSFSRNFSDFITFAIDKLVLGKIGSVNNSSPPAAYQVALLKAMVEGLERHYPASKPLDVVDYSQKKSTSNEKGVKEVYESKLLASASSVAPAVSMPKTLASSSSTTSTVTSTLSPGSPATPASALPTGGVTMPPGSLPGGAPSPAGKPPSPSGSVTTPSMTISGSAFTSSTSSASSASSSSTSSAPSALSSSSAAPPSAYSPGYSGRMGLPLVPIAAPAPVAAPPIAAPAPVVAPVPAAPLSRLEVQVRDAKARWEKIKNYKKEECDAAKTLITGHDAKLSDPEKARRDTLQRDYDTAAQALSDAADQVFANNDVQDAEDDIDSCKEAVDNAAHELQRARDERQQFFNQQQTKINGYGTQLAALSKQKQGLAQKRTQLENTSSGEVTAKQAQIDQAASRLSALENAVTQAERDEAAKKGDFAAAKNKYDALGGERGRIEDSITDLMADIKKANSAVETLEQKLSDIKRATAVAAQSKTDDKSIPLTTLSPSSSSSSSTSTVSTPKTQAQLEQELSVERAKRQRLQTDLQTKQAELAQVDAQLKNADTQLQAADRAFKAAQVDLRNAKTTLKNNRATLEQNIDTLTDDIDKIESYLGNELKKIDAASKQLNSGISALEADKRRAEAVLLDRAHPTASAILRAESNLQDAQRELEDAQSKLVDAYNQAGTGLEAGHLKKLTDAHNAARDYINFAYHVKLQHGTTKEIYDELGGAAKEFKNAFLDCKNASTLHLSYVKIFERILTAVWQTGQFMALENINALLSQMRKYQQQSQFFGDISNPQNAALQTAYIKCLNILEMMSKRQLEDFFGLNAQFHAYAPTANTDDTRNDARRDKLRELYPDAPPPAPGAAPTVHVSTGTSSWGHVLAAPRSDKGFITFESQFVNKCQITPGAAPGAAPTVTPTDKPVSYVAYQDNKAELQIKSYDTPVIPNQPHDKVVCRYVAKDGGRPEVVLYQSALNYAHELLFALTAGFTKKDDIISLHRIPSQECYDALYYVAKHYNVTLATRLGVAPVSSPAWYDTANPTKAVKTFIEQQKTSKPKPGYSYDPEVQKATDTADAAIKNALRKL